jgi:sigma-B regulation protein RsbU (phosphoserine phosphatase)
MLADAEIKAVLQNTKILTTLPDVVLAQLASALEEVAVKAGQVIFEKGDLGTAMYIVAEGQMRVHEDDLFLNHLSKGDVFGEMAALDSDVRSASVTAEVDSVLLRLDGALLYNLMSDRIEMVRAIIHGLCQHLRNRVQDLSDGFQYQQTLERELEIGRQIQASFLPEELPQPPGWQIAAYLKPAREVAGDFYDVFTLSQETKLAVIIGDVCDKGVGSALFMTLFRSLLRAMANLNSSTGRIDLSPVGSDPDRPGSVLASSVARLKNAVVQTNNYVAHTHSRAVRFTTLFFGLIDPASGAMVYINGGHEPPIILGPAGVKARLQPTGPVVGIFPELDYEIRETLLEPGDTLFLYTDGVTDIQDSAGEFFGEARLLSLLVQPVSSADDLLNHIESNLLAHMGAASQFDDITMLAVKRSR